MKLSIAIAKKIHLWIGLFSGIIVTMTGLSGSLYLWQPELSRLLNPKILSISGFESITESKIHKTSEGLFIRYKNDLTAINLPYREQQSIQLSFKNGDSYFFHPATGEMLGEKTLSIRFFEGLLNFHRTFLIPDYGKYIVGVNAVLFLSFVLTSGLYLWWKRYKKNIKKGFSLPKRTSKKLFNVDLHKVIGIFFLIPLLSMALSGSYFTFIPTWKSILKVFDSPTIKTGVKSSEPSNYIHPGDALRFPTNDGYRLRAVFLPSEKSEVYRFRYIRNRDVSSGLRKTKEIQIDSNNQVTILSEYNQSPPSEKIAAQAYPLHIGEIFGPVGRIVVFLTGFTPLILLITGYRTYKSRKLKKVNN